MSYSVTDYLWICGSHVHVSVVVETVILYWINLIPIAVGSDLFLNVEVHSCLSALLEVYTSGSNLEALQSFTTPTAGLSSFYDLWVTERTCLHMWWVTRRVISWVVLLTDVCILLWTVGPLTQTGNCSIPVSVHLSTSDIQNLCLNSVQFPMETVSFHLIW